MPKIPVDEAPAGPALDAAVAEALGLTVQWQSGEAWPIYLIGSQDMGGWQSQLFAKVLPYSANIAAAWELNEAIQSGFTETFLKFQALMNQDTVSQFERTFLWNLPEKEAALFISRAFLKACGVTYMENPEQEAP